MANDEGLGLPGTTVKDRRVDIRVNREEHPLFDQWIAMNSYYWHKALKDLVEGALQRGEVPMALPVTVRSKRSKAPRKRSNRANAISAEVMDQVASAPAQVVPDSHHEVVTESNQVPSVQTVALESEVVTPVVVDQAAGAQAVETVASNNDQGANVADAAPPIEEAKIGQTRVVDPALQAALKRKLMMNAHQFQIPEQ